MRLSIFSRLAIGYGAMLILLAGASIHTITELSRLRHVTTSIVAGDNQLFDLQKRLTDILLSEISLEKKFFIIRDAALASGFLRAGAEFKQNLGEALSHSDSGEIRDVLSRIKQSHDHYQVLFNDQTQSLKAGKKSPGSNYESETKIVTNSIMKELETLKVLNQQTIFGKIQNLNETQINSGKIALAMTAISLLLGVILSALITRSITRPISQLKKKTREIASGIYADNLQLSSPPELGELASAFNTMIGGLAEARKQIRSHETQLYEANDRLSREITEVRKAREELRKMTAELQRSNADLQQFAYAASHDLQEPLRVISGFINLLAQRYQGKLDAKADEYIAHTVNGAKRMTMLINDLLEYARVDTQGKVFAPVDCAPALAAALANLQKAVVESGAHITHDPLPTVRMDAAQLTSLFQNLIGNAIKFRADRPPEIQVSAARQDNDWVFSVRDNGIGIDAKFTGKIFDIFRRLHARDQREGSGIGLAICKKIVERHGGRIWVESTPGEGSTFYFTIPAMEAGH